MLESETPQPDAAEAAVPLEAVVPLEASVPLDAPASADSLILSAPPADAAAAPVDTEGIWVRAGREVVAGVKTLVSAAVYATLIVTFGFQVARVDGLSMAPTLEDHDRLIVNKLV